MPRNILLVLVAELVSIESNNPSGIAVKLLQPLNVLENISLVLVALDVSIDANKVPGIAVKLLQL